MTRPPTTGTDSAPPESMITDAHDAALKNAAGETVHAVAGVRDVANDLIVRVPLVLGRTDTDLACSVRGALESGAGELAASIHSTVHHAVVTLTGDVDTLLDAENAVDAARSVAGVRRVDDRLVVRTPVVNLFALHRSIENALGRRAHREADRIDLSATRGVVTLEGRLDSQSDKAAVLELARHAPGVRGIEDRLRVGR